MDDGHKKIIDAIIRIESSKVRVSDPAGNYPVCKNAIGTTICERCGNDISVTRGGPCPAFPPEKRWRFG